MSRAASAKGVIDYRPHIPRTLVAGSHLNCADNTGARELRLMSVIGYKGRLGRVPSGGVGDKVLISVKKGNPNLRKQVLPAILVRQRKPFRRANGVWVQFEDNAAVIVTPDGDLRGSEIKGAIAKEAAERWPRIAGAASIIL